MVSVLIVDSKIPAADISRTILPSDIISSNLASFGPSPYIGAATGTSLAVTGEITSSNGAIGYTAGNGGSVTQSTSKATTVTLNKLMGDITTANVELAAGAIVSFRLTNNTIGATDIIHLQHQDGGTFGAYTFKRQNHCR